MLKKMLLLIGLLAGMFSVQAQTNTVSVGNGAAKSNVTPFNFNASTGAGIAIYSSQELNGIQGSINSLVFEGNFSKEFTATTLVYIGETDKVKLDFDNPFSISPSTLTKVFDGEMTFPQGDHQSVEFTFTQPYAYSGERNLVVYTFSRIAKADMEQSWGATYFYATNTGNNVLAAYAQNDNMNPKEVDPMQPYNADYTIEEFNRPDIKVVFSSVSEETYNLTFDVRDAEGQTIPDAIVTLDDTTYEAGKYAFEDMPARAYNYLIEKEGLIPVKGNVRLNQDTTLTVNLIARESTPHLSGYLFEDFENITQEKRPLNWSGSFYVDTMGGKDGGHRLTHSFWFADGSRACITNPIVMGSNPVFEFDYRVMDRLTYPYNAFAGQNMTWRVDVSIDLGESWETLFNEDYGVHQASKEYKPFSLDVSAYAGKTCQFQIYVYRDYQNGADEFYFDIDNIKIGTQPTKDLAVVSKIEKGLRVLEAGAKTTYTVCLRNEGSEDVENYSLKFYNGTTEIGSVPGTKLESGAFTRLNFEHSFAQEGEYTLTAACVMEDDEIPFNNTTAEYYVSVQPEGIRSSMVEAYEGEEMSYHAPLSMYGKYSLSWLLYDKQDLNLKSGNNISGIAFRTKFTQSTERLHLTVYIGETSTFSLAVGTPAPTSLTKVFDGGVTINDLDGGNLVINFDRVYRYTGKNLVVAVYKDASQVYSFNVPCGFYGQTALGAVCVEAVRSEEPIDPSITLSAEELQKAIMATKPSTIFLLNDDVSLYSVNFEITDLNGVEVSNAIVTFDGRELPEGNYTVENVPDGTYTYSVRLQREVVEGSVTVNGADVTEKVQLQLIVANENKVEETMASIYPNPTDGKLHINVAQGAKEINLYDISGRSVRRISRVPAGIIELDMTDCHSGIYLLKIDNQAFKVSKR